MTFIVPNHFLEQHPSRVIASDVLFWVTYTSRKNNDNMTVRNTTHVMILLIKGRKNLKTYDAEYNLKAGDILLLTQGNYFMSELVSEDGAYEAILIYFDDSFIAEFNSKYEIDLDSTKSQDIAIFTSNALLKNLTNSYKLYMDQNLEKQSDIIKLKTQEIFLHLLELDKKNFCAYLYAVSSTAKERVKHILEANLDIIESVEDMCRIARVSKSELRAATQTSFNLKPKAWLDKKRLEQAVMLLSTTDKTISDIATTCGYATPSWFGVQFKKQYHCTPKAYRKNLNA